MREELALHGGPRTAVEPFPPWPQFSERSLAEALEPLRSGRVASWSGTRCAEFEDRWAQWAGAAHAVACSSGTAALHLALVALGIGPGDEVLVPSHTFISTSLAVVHAGALPVFCDVSDDQTLDPRSLEERVTARARAVIVVHLYGIVADMDRIRRVAASHGLAVIEDCAQCAGGELNGRKAGTLGDAGCFSFSQGKHVCTAGEGGMVVTAVPDVARACRSLRDYGREQDASGPAAHVRAGYNYRLTEIQASVGLGELARLDSWNLARRAGFAKSYDHAFSQLAGVRALPLNTTERRNAWWKYPLQLDIEHLAAPPEEIRAAVLAEGLPDAGSAWPESYDEPVFQDRPSARCPNAEALRRRTLMLGLPPTWERGHVDVCISAVKKVLRAYRR
ncbi:MAG TPA: DegT/DnrJ/EryC1/StrS family aminotransferase [Spirochaetia bacterium]|nr:DegT/DnrJ/EryC1/StrS family aminotransferase [Spirochaetia bacterium]